MSSGDGTQHWLNNDGTAATACLRTTAVLVYV
jgi:hypothetical protein